MRRVASLDGPDDLRLYVVGAPYYVGLRFDDQVVYVWRGSDRSAVRLSFRASEHCLVLRGMGVGIERVIERGAEPADHLRRHHVALRR